MSGAREVARTAEVVVVRSGDRLDGTRALSYRSEDSVQGTGRHIDVVSGDRLGGERNRIRSEGRDRIGSPFRVVVPCVPGDVIVPFGGLITWQGSEALDMLLEFALVAKAIAVLPIGKVVVHSD